MDPVLLEHLRRWRVEADGPQIRTPSSLLVTGRRDDRPVVLKVPLVEEERRGSALLAAWRTPAAIPVLEWDGSALLMERATGSRSLVAMAADGRDDEATDVLVDTALALHAEAPDAEAVPLRTWFRGLLEAPPPDPLLAAAARVARTALDETTEADVVVLHGDLHHGNVLDLGDRWAAIDPKALLGHRAFDLANPLVNPSAEIAVARLDERMAAISARAGLDERLLARWIVAWCGLSLSWADGAPTDHGRAARAVAEALLPRC